MLLNNVVNAIFYTRQKYENLDGKYFCNITIFLLIHEKGEEKNN